MLSHPVCLKPPGLLRKDPIYLSAWTCSGPHANTTQKKKGANRTAHLQMQIVSYMHFTIITVVITVALWYIPGVDQRVK